jgi:hypothetical protein
MGNFSGGAEQKDDRSRLLKKLNSDEWTGKISANVMESRIWIKLRFCFVFKGGELFLCPSLWTVLLGTKEQVVFAQLMFSNNTSIS